MFLVVGAGGIGASLAARLALLSDVTILDGWDEHVSAIERSGLKLSLPNAEYVVRLPAMTYGQAAASGLPGDLSAVLLSVKSFETSQTLDWLLPRLPDHVPIVSLQNGLNEYTIAERIGPERTVGAVVMFDGILVGPGHALTHRPRAALTIGNWGAAGVPDLSALGASLAAATPVEVSEDIRAALWGKLIINCAVNAPAAAAGLGLRDLVRVPTGRTACAEIAAEAVQVADALGIRLARDALYGFDTGALLASRDAVGRLAELFGSTFADSDLRPSMLTDVERGRRTEIGALNRVVVDEGRRHGINTPWNEHFSRVVADIESGAAQPDEGWLTR